MVTLSQTRGDTRGYKFQRKNSAGEVITTEPDALFVTIKTDWNTDDIVFQIKMDEMTLDENGWWHWHTEPQDTAELPYGKYYGDVEVHKNGGIFTISKFVFQITEEATWSSGEKEY